MQMSFCDGDYRDYMQSLKQRAHNIGYTLGSPVSVPFCPECHSYPCSCDDNIVQRRKVYSDGRGGVYELVENYEAKQEFLSQRTNPEQYSTQAGN